jgi:hypothetical protein
MGGGREQSGGVISTPYRRKTKEGTMFPSTSFADSPPVKKSMLQSPHVCPPFVLTHENENEIEIEKKTRPRNVRARGINDVDDGR